MDSYQFPEPFPIVGGAYRKNVPWHQMKIKDPLRIVNDPNGSVVGDKHSDPLALAVYWGDHHIGYLKKGQARELAPLLQKGLIELITTLAWLDGPSNIESIITVRAVKPCEQSNSG